MKYIQLLGILVVSATASHAATTIGTYEFTGNSLAASDTVVGIGMSDVSLNSFPGGSLFDNANLDGTGAVSDFLRFSGDDTESGIATAFSGGLYISFTVTNNTGNSISLDSLSIGYQKQNTFGLDSALFSDGQGFDNTADDRIGTLEGTYISGNDASFVSETFDLTGGFEGGNIVSSDFVLADGAARVFYIAVRQNSTSTTRAFDIDNVSLAIIPEPGTYTLLFGMFAVSYIALKRREG